MLVYAHRFLDAHRELQSWSLRNATYVDLGHHLNLGLLRPLINELQGGGAIDSVAEARARARALGEDSSLVGVVRLIRNRYDTVRSFASERKFPCDERSNGMFTLCPRLHKPALEPPEGVWEQLDGEQRLLWFIDEVEARWQHVLQAQPGIEHLTVSYCDSKEGLAPVWGAVAKFIGGDAAPGMAPAACASHHHTDESLRLSSDEELARKDAEYWRLMGYDAQPELAKLVAATQQAAICNGAGASATRRRSGEQAALMAE